MNFLTNLNLTKNQLLNASIHNATIAPSNPVIGQIYYNTISNRAFIYNGTIWIGMDATDAQMTGEDIVDEINSSSSIIDNDNLSSGVNTAISNSHTHSNKSTLDAITAAFTTADESKLDSLDATKQHTQNTDTGTSSSYFQIDNGSSGPKLVNTNGVLCVMNSSGSSTSDLRVDNLTVDGTLTTVSSEDVNIGDSIITLNSDITSHTQNSNGGLEVKRLAADDLTRKDAKITFNSVTNNWELTDGSISNSLITSTIARKLVFEIGDGTSNQYTISHYLNTRDLTVIVRETTSPYSFVLTDIEFYSLNELVIKFAEIPTTNQYTLTIIG